MHVYPCVEYWYNFSSVLPTSLLHSLAFLFIVFLPIPLCNSLLFWSLLIAEMIMLHRAPGHPPARKVCVTCLEDFCCGLSCGAGWWKPLTFELKPYSISSHKSFLWLHCLWKNSSWHLPLLCSYWQVKKHKNDLTVFCKARAEGWESC